ncbi:MAG: hypothetical protein IIB62_09050, partial [Proteobacteria bacterium]|nr:hypothetical protein [Pseudomonadota bacterium]
IGVALHDSAENFDFIQHLPVMCHEEKIGDAAQDFTPLFARSFRGKDVKFRETRLGAVHDFRSGRELVATLKLAHQHERLPHNIELFANAARQQHDRIPDEGKLTEVRQISRS